MKHWFYNPKSANWALKIDCTQKIIVLPPIFSERNHQKRLKIVQNSPNFVPNQVSNNSELIKMTNQNFVVVVRVKNKKSKVVFFRSRRGHIRARIEGGDLGFGHWTDGIFEKSGHWTNFEKLPI